MTLYRNNRPAYSSQNFRSDDGRWEWQTMQERWRTERLFPAPPARKIILALCGSQLLTALGGFDVKT